MFVALILIDLLAVFSLFRYFTPRLDRIKSQMDAQTTEFVTHLKTANREMPAVIASAQWASTATPKSWNGSSESSRGDDHSAALSFCRNFSGSSLKSLLHSRQQNLNSCPS